MPQREDAWTKDLLDLKRTPRSGWFRIGVERPESVADHSYAVGLLAWRMARERGLDAERALLMGLLHDFHEARLGDLAKPAKAVLGEAAVAAAERSLVRAQWPEAPEIVSLLEEFLAGETEEAKLVREVDALDLRLQARRYRAAGHEGADDFLGEGD